MRIYTVNFHFNDVCFQGTISCDADWISEEETLEWSGPYRRVEYYTELNELSNIKILDMGITTPTYDSYLYTDQGLETRVWEHYLNQSLENTDLLSILEDSICENHDIMEEES